MMLVALAVFWVTTKYVIYCRRDVEPFLVNSKGNVS